MVAEGLTVGVVFVDLGAPRVASGAGFHLLVRRARFRSFGCGFLGLELPQARIRVFQINQKPSGGILLVRGLGPSFVARARAVASFARNIEFKPLGVVGIGGRVVLALQISRMTFGAHEIPRLKSCRPVKEVVGWHLLVWVEMEPSLATVCLGSRIPNHVQGLQTAVGKADQVLFEGRVAKNEGDGKIGQSAVWSICAHFVSAVVNAECGCDVEVCEDCIVKIGRYGFCAGHLHGQIVVGSSPLVSFFGVTASARGAANPMGLLRCWAGTYRGRFLVPKQVPGD